MRALIMGLALVGSVATAMAGDLAKPKLLSHAEASRWIAAAREHRTAEGTTVAQVLAFAERMRPKEFKVGAMEEAYNGATGEPDSVLIGYWLGAKRLPGDEFGNLGYDVSVSPGGKISLKPIAWPLQTALEAGRDAFLRAIDGEYRDECIDAETEEKMC